MLDQLTQIVLALLTKVLRAIQNFFTPKQTVSFENGPTVTIQQKIAEGGFSYVYSATDIHNPKQKYALKRIICNDDEILDACRREAEVHRTCQKNNNNPNILRLLNVKFVHHPQSTCYMLFPLIRGGSLRDEITKRKLLSDHHDEIRPFDEWQILKLFRGVLKGVIALHINGYTHRDIKLENILLDKESGDEETMMNSLGTPILMDFGSVSGLVVKLDDRRTVLNLTEEASIHSTISYRAPELFDGGCRHGLLEPDIDGRVDVWSCGCLLYGIMYGTSPFEMEFRNDGSSSIIRIKECTHLGILGGKIPYPTGTRQMVYNYRREMHELVEWMLVIDRTERPTVEEIYDRVESMLMRRGGGMIV